MLDSPPGRNWKSWTSAYGGFFYWYKGDIHHCVIDANNDIDMSVLNKTDDENFSNFVELTAAGISWPTGKVAAGLLPGGFLYVGVQPDSEGSLSVDDARDRLADAECADAVMLDGSDSAMMYFNGEWKARQGWGKNRVTRVGLCFQ